MGQLLTLSEGSSRRGETLRFRGGLRSLCAVTLLVVLSGCKDSDAKQTRPLVLVASGDTAGWIVPCGCASNQSGGLLRRGEYIDKLSQRADVVYVDVGGAVRGTSEYDIAKLEAIMRGEMAMGVTIHNIGAAEAALGADALRRMDKKLGEPMLFTSANVRDADGEKIISRYQLVKSSGRRIFITGVLSQELSPPGIQVTPPLPAILDALEATRGRRDTAIILVYAPEAELRELARQLPEVDAIIGGPTGQAIAPQRIGPTLLAAATNKGKFLVELKLPAPESGDHVHGKVVEISEDFDDHPAQRRNLKVLYAMLADRDFTPEQTSFVSDTVSQKDNDVRIAGTHACVDCHMRDCELWDGSAHAHAWATLKKDGSHVDSYCQQCHVTGYGLAGGFVSAKRTPQFASVGCESCHGPSQAHVDDSAVHTAYYQSAASTCVTCHDRENSPQFDYDHYWAQIEHGTQGGNE